jgi:hypothetical protein
MLICLGACVVAWHMAVYHLSQTLHAHLYHLFVARLRMLTFHSLHADDAQASSHVYHNIPHSRLWPFTTIQTGSVVLQALLVQHQCVVILNFDFPAHDFNVLVVHVCIVPT